MVGIRILYPEQQAVRTGYDDIKCMYMSEFVLNRQTGKFVKERIPFKALLTPTEQVLYGEEV